MQNETSHHGFSPEAITAAMAETEAILEADPSRSIADPSLPVYKVAALEQLDREWSAFKAGDKMALLGAIRICANHDMVMPAWVATGYIRAYDKVLRARVGSWDEAFGKPFDGKFMDRRRTERNAMIVYLVDKALAAGDQITDAMDAVAEQKNVSRKTVENAYYKARRAKKGNS
jgi:hypothetical protein